MGADFELDTVRRASVVHEPALIGAIEEAVRSGLLVEEPGRGLAYRFAHELVRRAVDDRLSAARRAEIHLRVAEALEHGWSGGDSRAVLAALAHHYAAGACRGADGRSRTTCRRPSRLSPRLRSGGGGLVSHRRARRQRSARAREGDAQLETGDALVADGSRFARLQSLHAAGGRRVLCARRSASRRRAAMTTTPGSRAARGDRHSAGRLCAPALGGLHRADLRGDSGRAARARLSIATRGAATPAAGTTRTVLLVAGSSTNEEVNRMPGRRSSGWSRRRQIEGRAVLRRRTFLRSDSRGTPPARRREKLSQLFSFTSPSSRERDPLQRELPRRGTAQRRRSGEAPHGRDASGTYAIQMFGIRREQGRLGELAPVVRMLDVTRTARGGPPCCPLQRARTRKTPVASCNGPGGARRPASPLAASSRRLPGRRPRHDGDGRREALIRAAYSGGNVMAVACYGADRYLGMTAATRRGSRRGALVRSPNLRWRAVFRHQAASWPRERRPLDAVPS
jgi:hypothetical protein